VTAPAPSIADRTALALVLIAGFGAMYALIAWFALDRFPYSGDEYSLVLQGELFARGLWKAAAPPHIEWLRVDHVMIDGWVRSKYPPGASALLALGARHGAAWLVTPIEAMIALTVVWHTTRRLLGRREALVALIVLGLAPLFAFQAASFYAHTATVMFLAIAYAGVAAWTQRPRTGWLVLVGAALGCCFLTRPVDALLFGAAMLALRSPRAIIITAVSAVPAVALHLAYQAAQFGSPFADGYGAYQPTLEALYGADIAPHPVSPVNLWDPVQVWNHLDIARAFALDWTVPGTVVVALVGASAIGRDHPARPMRTFSIALIAVCVAALWLTIADVDDGARPRYLSPILIPVAVLTAAGFAPAASALASRLGRRVRTALVAIAIGFAPLELAWFLYRHVPLVSQRAGLYRVVEAAGLRDAIVIVRAQYPSRYARNGPLFDRDVRYLSPPAATAAAVIAAAYPERAIWEAHEGHGGTPWTLSRVR
jgi:4-amino-4-deoxy-L-arabinose transferase-like glycosyltransferase